MRLQARAGAAVSVPLVVQQIDAPNDIYLFQTLNLTASAQSFDFELTAGATTGVGVALFLGEVGEVAVFVDDVSVVESDPQPMRPVITEVINAATLQAGLSPVSWVTIKGFNLSPTPLKTWDNDVVDGRLPTSLDGVSAWFGGTPAYVYFISPGQLNVLAPPVEPGSTSLSVTTPNGSSVEFPVTVTGSAPGIFLWPENQTVATRTDGSLAVAAETFAGLATQTVRPGDILILWGTGFGPTNPTAEPGMTVPSDRQYNCGPVEVLIGTVRAEVFGCALSPGSAGLYQVAVRIPEALADGNYSVRLTVGGNTSPESGVVVVRR